MRRDRTKLVRRGLLALLLVVGGAVAWSLRRAPVTAPSPRPSASPGEGTTVSDMTFLRFKEGERDVSIQARAMTGREGESTRFSGVEVGVPFVARGRPSTATIVADECLYQPAPLRASFRGNVRVRTDDGFELESESLKYWAEEGRMFSRDAVRFRRGRAKGSARGMDYRQGEGLALNADVKLRFESETGPPTDVEAGGSHASRDERVVDLLGGVVVRQGSRELRSRNLQVHLDEELQEIERAVATEDVDLRTRDTGATAGSLGAAASSGEERERRLRCRRLDMAIRPGGVLQEAACDGQATLEVSPGPAEPRESQRIAAPRLRFRFDEQGRLVSLHGLPGVTAGRGTVITTEPAAGSPGVARRIQADAFEAQLDAESGNVRAATFEGSFAFSEPGRRAWAQRAAFDEAAGQVTLSGGEPRLQDDSQGGELRGRQIVIGTRSRAVSASGSVRHTIPPAGKGAASGPLSGEEPTVVVCRRFDYDPSARRARYEENAVMRSGADEIRASSIVVEEPAERTRRLAASGGVTSTLHPRPKEPAVRPAAPVGARSREMTWEESERRVVYTGDVELRQGDLLTKSPEAVVLLSANDGAMERLVAGSPVEVRQGARVARGERATYTPADETVVLVGEKVVVQDGDRRLEGRVLTFQSGSDRIRVDGREEVRSEAVFRKQPPKP